MLEFIRTSGASSSDVKNTRLLLVIHNTCFLSLSRDAAPHEAIRTHLNGQMHDDEPSPIRMASGAHAWDFIWPIRTSHSSCPRDRSFRPGTCSRTRRLVRQITMHAVHFDTAVALSFRRIHGHVAA
jgi:hypothetical protein